MGFVGKKQFVVRSAWFLEFLGFVGKNQFVVRGSRFVGCMGFIGFGDSRAMASCSAFSGPRDQSSVWSVVTPTLPSPITKGEGQVVT